MTCFKSQFSKTTGGDKLVGWAGLDAIALYSDSIWHDQNDYFQVDSLAIHP